jgi:3-phosphoshikimate 1-carboxyvinyltransferase
MSALRQAAGERLHVRPGASLSGRVRVPGDKSLSHRVLILGGLADGVSEIEGFLPAGDTLATLACIRALDVLVEQADESTLRIHGRGLQGLTAPPAALDCVNAGTGLRLLAGVLAGQPFASVLDGSDQLRGRPMGRITAPLRAMGARVEDDGHAPLYFLPSRLTGITYEMPVASAQVKSCLLLAGLFAEGPTTVIEPGPARDHTERLLGSMGAAITVTEGRITLTPGQPLRPLHLTIPGDISSAAFVLVAGLLGASGEVRIDGVGVNPTRSGILDILAEMGAEIEQVEPREEAGEPVADLIVRQTALVGAEIDGPVVIRAIDEFPALMVAATQAAGETVVRDAAELRVKETDRIAVMAGELRKMGTVIHEQPDGFRVVGPQRLQGAVVDGHDDHRVAMALAVAGLVAAGETVVEDAGCIADSFPGFDQVLRALGADMMQVGHD